MPPPPAKKPSVKTQAAVAVQQAQVALQTPPATSFSPSMQLTPQMHDPIESIAFHVKRMDDAKKDAQNQVMKLVFLQSLIFTRFRLNKTRKSNCLLISYKLLSRNSTI
jgi:hypothetical protein